MPTTMLTANPNFYQLRIKIEGKAPGSLAVIRELVRVLPIIGWEVRDDGTRIAVTPDDPVEADQTVAIICPSGLVIEIDGKRAFSDMSSWVTDIAKRWQRDAALRKAAA